MASIEAENQNVLTPEGKAALEKELDELIKVERDKNKQELALARSQGDLSENADYDAARNRQAEIEERIKQIQHILDTSVVIKKDKNTSVIQLGSVVTVKRVDNEKIIKFQVVGSSESDLTVSPKKVALDAPLAAAVYEHKIGDIVEVKAHNPYKIEITASK